jgi:ABC-type transport system involved in multi-copper enzyme maturation permease subunit
VLILIAFMFSFVLAMSAAFLAAPAIASDVETGTVLAMLARPLRRADLVLGRWLGLAIMVAGYTALSGLLAIAVVGMVSGHVPPQPLVAVAFLAFQAIAVLTLALTLGTRLPSIAAGAITVVLFGLGWFAGVLGNIAIAFDAGPLAGGTDLVRVLLPTDGLWRGVIFGLEPPLVLLAAAGRNTQAMQANPFFASTPPPLPFVAWCVLWVGLVLVAGIALFRRREL